MELVENMQTIHMYINNEEVVCDKKIDIVKQFNNTNTTVLNNCYPLSWEEDKDYVSRFYMPKDYSLFKMTRDYAEQNITTENEVDILTEDGQDLVIGAMEEVVFFGVVKRSNEVDLRPYAPHFATLQVLDMKTFLSEGDLFNFVLTEMTIEDAIEYVISQYSKYNFTTGILNIGSKLLETIGTYNCNQKTLYDVLEYFAQITNSVWTTRYVSDTETAIDFYTLDMLPKGIDLVYDQSFCDNNSIIDITYNINTSNYRNKQIMTSNIINSNILNTQNYITTGMEYVTDENIASISEATIDGIEITVATTQDKENGQTADLYYEVGSNKFELSEQVLPGHNLQIKYYSQIPGRQVVLNQDEIARIDDQLDNSGIIARYENRQDTNSSQELNSIGQTYIQFKGKPEVTLTVRTINNDIYEVGNVVYFDTNNTEGLEDLIDNYAVKEKTIQIIQNNTSSTGNVFYTYKLSNNYNFDAKINYFDNQRAKNIGNIKEGEFINRYIENYKKFNIVFNAPNIVGGV